MKIITFEKIKNLGISPKQCYDWIIESILNKNNSILPKKISMKPKEWVFFNIMPTIIHIDKKTIAGIKVVSRFPDNIPSLESSILLYNADNGEHLALMDADWITAMRTGAVATHSIKLLAKRNYKNIGLVGLGNVSAATMLILDDILDYSVEVKLLRYKNQAEKFIERFKNAKHFKFRIVDSMKETIENSDVVISGVTYFKNDVAKDEWFKPGVLVVPIHTRGFSNCDLSFDKVFVDDINHVSDFRYFNDFKYISEICDVISGKKDGRINDNEKIIAYNIGIAIHDIYFGYKIYNLLSNEKIDEIEIKSKKDKLWV